MAKQNRAQRRDAEFRPKATTTEPDRTTSAALQPKGEAVAGRPDQDQSEAVGPGTGGATESDQRIPRHAGTHATNSAKG